MISDEERREVAAKLRERTKRPLGKSMQLMFSETLGLYRTITFFTKEKATETWDAIVRYLAELIDRPTGIATKAADGYAVCHTCGANFIVSVPAAFRCEEEAEANYCPCCGTPLEWRNEDD